MTRNEIGEIERHILESMREYGIPEYMHQPVIRWVMDGMGPGSFLTAVICNDFSGVMRTADENNIRLLPQWAKLMRRLPSDCWGNSAAYRYWPGLRKMTADQGLTDGPRKEEP